jgi:hypothetical protein
MTTHIASLSTKVGQSHGAAKQETNMRSKIQAQARVQTADELRSARTTQIFGLAMTAVFLAMLILNAISY